MCSRWQQSFNAPCGMITVNSYFDVEDAQTQVWRPSCWCSSRICSGSQPTQSSALVFGPQSYERWWSARSVNSSSGHDAFCDLHLLWDAELCRQHRCGDSWLLILALWRYTFVSDWRHLCIVCASRMEEQASMTTSKLYLTLRTTQMSAKTVFKKAQR